MIKFKVKFLNLFGAALGGIFFLTQPCALFADEGLPPYPTKNPDSANLATYYQALSTYYQNESKVYAKKAKIELQAAQKEKKLTPVAIKNPKPFTGSNVGLGFVMNTGNTSSQNFKCL